jgi:hypothetical protein
MSFLELKIPPLLLVLLFALVMWLLAPFTAPLSAQLALPALDTTVLALCLTVTGIAVALAGVLAFTVTAVIQYIWGFLLLLAAVACYLQSVVALAWLPLFVYYLNQFQMKPEERFLGQKFGQDYQVYMKQVRRWL